MRAAFLERAWVRFAHDARLAAWVAASLPAARAAVADPGNRHWLRHGGTWFAGVNGLANDATGAVPGGVKLSGAAVDFIARELGFSGVAWDRGQVSVCYPGYPGRSPDETEAAHRYRRERDAAHVDGLLAEGPGRRRHLREPHGFLFGIPMTETSGLASPFTVWEGSHEVMRRVFRAALAGVEPERWGEVDLTEAYHAARREAFAACRRVVIQARPGEAYVVHRLALHGMAAWGEDGAAGPDGRMIVYFRPVAGGLAEWLSAP